MGNISIMLRLGKKVFLRPNTSMWNYFLTQGYSIYDANELNNISFHDFIHIDESISRHNILVAEEKAQASIVNSRVAWEAVFKD